MISALKETSVFLVTRAGLAFEGLDAAELITFRSQPFLISYLCSIFHWHPFSLALRLNVSVKNRSSGLSQSTLLHFLLMFSCFCAAPRQQGRLAELSVWCHDEREGDRERSGLAIFSPSGLWTPCNTYLTCDPRLNTDRKWLLTFHVSHIPQRQVKTCCVSDPSLLQSFTLPV